MKRRLWSALLVLGVGLGLGLVGCSQEPATEGERPLVVTSVPIIYSLTANVAGDDVRLENILPPGVTPHDVTFTPEQVTLVASADLLVENGAKLESGWLDDLVKSAGRPELQRVAAAEGIELREPDEPVEIPDGGEPEGHEEPEDVDPHVWVDVSNAQQMVRNIAEGLKSLDPAHADDYERRAQEYITRLQALDEEIRTKLADLPSRDFVAFHSAFGYYAHAYGLRQVAVIEEFPGKQPSPRYLAAIVDLVKSTGVRAVFSEPQFSPRPAEALARETGAKVYEVDPEGSSLDPALYEDLMRSNTETFREALGGGS